MFKRILVGVLLVPVLLVVLFAPKIVGASVLSVLCAIASYELACGAKLIKHPRLQLYTIIFSILIPFWCYFGSSRAAALLGLTALFIVLFLEIMISGLKIPVSQIGVCLFAGVLIPYMLSAVLRILCMEHGRFYILIPFIAAFLSDIGAYFVGVFMGKHPLCPTISPKKTLEGFVGGIVSAVLGMLIYGIVLQLAFDFTVNYLYVLIYGVLGSLVGVIGDLSFSVIKRQVGIKDYGNLFPGHGGVLDRFDSVIVVAPLMEALLLLIPMAY